MSMKIKKVWRVGVLSCKACHVADLAIMLPDVLIVLLAAVLHCLLILRCPLCRLRWDFLCLPAQTLSLGYLLQGLT